MTTGFSVFVGAYAEARDGLRHASQQLSLPEDHALADTALGRQAVIDAASQATLASISSMLGALVPLLIAIVLPGPGWIALVIAIGALGVFGVGLAQTVTGKPWIWGPVLAVGGAAVAAVELCIKIT